MNELVKIIRIGRNMDNSKYIFMFKGTDSIEYCARGLMLKVAHQLDMWTNEGGCLPPRPKEKCSRVHLTLIQGQISKGQAHPDKRMNIL